MHRHNILNKRTLTASLVTALANAVSSGFRERDC
jgi:hypothetical protein